MKVMIPEGEGAVLRENVPDMPNTPMNCEFNWSMQRRAHDRGRRLIASVGRVLSVTKGAGIANSGRSLISLIALLTLCCGILLFCVLNEYLH